MIIFYSSALLIAIFIDLISVFCLKKTFRNSTKNGVKKVAIYLIWSTTIAAILYTAIYSVYLRNSTLPEYSQYVKTFWIRTILLLVYLPKIIFAFLILLETLLKLLWRLVFRKENYKNKIINVLFFSYRRKLIPYLAIFIAAYSESEIIYGIFYGRYNFAVNQVELIFPKIPKAFDRFRIVQISDVHLGSFDNPDKIKEAVKIINSQYPDLIVLTGDLINVCAEEANPFIDELQELKAPYGKYAIIGNHDIGDYRRWYSIPIVNEDPRKVETLFKQIDFTLLRNNRVYLKKGIDQYIGLIGIDNCGKAPYKCYGDLNKATEGMAQMPFNILLSHDPNFWETNVVGKTKIDLTLSGHTHGGQIAFPLFGMKWSPISFSQKYVSGLFKEGSQYLYVNQGLGYLGFNARVNVPPEITLIVLRKD